ncbi:MAG: hypothetical protein WCD18_16765 [Thermosynechococcaceae cyanobacterium]
MSATFTLLSLGHRGVGKTVFLASNCAEILRSGQRKNKSQNLWFECSEEEYRNDVENLVGYVVRTGQYPPPTFKIGNFGFNLMGKGISGDRILCHFRWLDLPGEWCDVENPEFQSLLLNSHGCCVFIDAYALLTDPTYLKTLDKIMNQLEAIAALANRHNLKYPFSLICTKCDLIESGPIGLVQLEEKLKPLTQRLDAVNARYQRFYSAIPILNQENGGILQFKGATAPLLWLIAELRKLHPFDEQTNLGSSLNQVLSNSPTTYESKLIPFRSPLRLSPKVLGFGLVGVGVLASITALALNWGSLDPKAVILTPEQQLQKYEAVLKTDPTNREAVTRVVDAYAALGQYDKATTRVESLLQTSPKNVDLLFELSGLYSITGQDVKEEQVYDRILAQQSDNILALTGKASLRSKKGDFKTAKALFKKAEQYAPTDSIKDKINQIENNKIKP